jgi:hypothetical protein
MKNKETLEDASWKYNPLKKLDGEFLRHAFKEGAKSDAAKDYWFEKFKQEERSYSEKDLEKAFKIGFTIGYSNDVRIDERDKSFNRWFEQFKNK